MVPLLLLLLLLLNPLTSSLLPCILPPYTLFFLTNMNMTVEVDNKGPAVCYLDPECLCLTTLNSTDNAVTFSVDYMLRAFEQYSTKDLMLTAYLSTNHSIVVMIVLKQRKVYYLDSLETINTNTRPLELIINE
jgi:hypothetical protein